MIKANELRHCNYYHFSGNSEGMFDYENEIGRVMVNDDFSCYVDLKGMSNEMLSEFSLEQIKPIPLTPEILVKCGFVLDEDNGDSQWFKYPHHINNYHIQQDHDCWVFSIVHSDGSYTDLIYDKDHFQHLHHLQNIFHALTGEELEYNT